MQPVSTRRLIRFTPDGAQALPGQDAPPVYLLRVPSLLDRSEIESAVVSAGVRPVAGPQIRVMLRAAIQRRIGDPGPYEEALDRQDAGESDDQDIALLQDAELQVSDDPQYARLIAMRMRWEPFYQWFALRYLLDSIENSDVEVEREGSLVTEATLEQIPRRHQEAVSRRAMELAHLGDEEKKDSASPSP